MPKRLVVDLRQGLRDFASRIDDRDGIPEYVLSEVVLLVFDVLIFELEDSHEEPELSRLGNFYRDRLEKDPRYMQRFLDSFFLLVKSIAGQLKAAGFYTGEGFEFAPEINGQNRRIIVKRFENPIY